MRICVKNCLLRECVFYNENAFGGYCSSKNECELGEIGKQASQVLMKIKTWDGGKAKLFKCNVVSKELKV